MEFAQLYKSEGYGGSFSRGIDIKVHAPVGVTEGLRRAAYEAARILEEQITRDFYANDPESQKRASEEKWLLLSCFPGRIFARPVPNGYCNRACCEHRPWFEVTSRVGPVRVGWRKRVITIDWSDSTITATADDLFPGEDVTKHGRMIHAWDYDKARAYLAVILRTSAD